MGIRWLCAWDRSIVSAVRVEQWSGGQLTCANTDTLTWLPWLFAGHRVTPGAVSILADGLHLLLGETDYHRLPIYPHKHPSCTESVPKCYVNIAQASKLFHTWSTSYANNVTKITRSGTQCKKRSSPVSVRHTRLGRYSRLHESAISCHSSQICPPAVHIFKVLKGFCYPTKMGRFLVQWSLQGCLNYLQQPVSVMRLEQILLKKKIRIIAELLHLGPLCISSLH